MFVEKKIKVLLNLLYCSQQIPFLIHLANSILKEKILPLSQVLENWKEIKMDCYLIKKKWEIRFPWHLYPNRIFIILIVNWTKILKVRRRKPQHYAYLLPHFDRIEIKFQHFLRHTLYINIFLLTLFIFRLLLNVVCILSQN